jgi:1-acyl-sn-glycerol-3-phosphate acyltransferase
MGALRAGSILAAFFLLTITLMPAQALFVRFSPARARRLPHWYHRKVCKLLGVRLHVNGAIVQGGPALLISNHTSWLDIPVLSAVAPVSFVAKKEVGSWPFVSALARLQRTVFIDRTRRQAAGEAAGEITARLTQGDAIVLFPEGTSSDGNRVLPFKSSLFGAVKPGARPAGTSNAVVQTIAIVYTHLRGVPLGRGDRPRVGWYGDMEMTSHAWALLKSGPLDVTVQIGAPVGLQSFAGRKELALQSERDIRTALTRILRARPDDEPLDAVEPKDDLRRSAAGQRRAESGKWT